MLIALYLFLKLSLQLKPSTQQKSMFRGHQGVVLGEAGIFSEEFSTTILLRE